MSFDLCILPSFLNAAERKLSVLALNMCVTLRIERCDIFTICCGNTAMDLADGPVDSRPPYRSNMISVSSALAIDYEALNFFLGLLRAASDVLVGGNSRY